MSKSWLRTDNEYSDFGPLFTGQVLRDEGISQVLGNNKTWLALCQQTAEVYARCHDTFTGEDIRFHCASTVACPNHHNAWGALINSLVKRGIIEKTGEYRPMRDDNSHARSTPVYRRVSRCEQPDTATT